MALQRAYRWMRLHRYLIVGLILCITWVSFRLLVSIGLESNEPLFYSNSPYLDGEQPFLRSLVRPEVKTTLLEPKITCDDGALFIIVCSAASNFLERQAIRDTWGSISNTRKDIKLVFLLGTANNTVAQGLISLESRNYSDIVQEDFMDTYENLTVKTVMMLKWLNRTCWQIPFVLKVDDDMFVNVPNLLISLKRWGHPNLLMGSTITGAQPIRDPTSKWFSPRTYVEKSYPTYLSGTAYVFSGDLISKLYVTALNTPLFRLEDVFLTGICARHLRLQHEDNPCFHYGQVLTDPCRVRQIITTHRLKPSTLYEVWRRLNDPDLTCSKLLSFLYVGIMEWWFCY